MVHAVCDECGASLSKKMTPSVGSAPDKIIHKCGERPARVQTTIDQLQHPEKHAGEVGTRVRLLSMHKIGAPCAVCDAK
jgi:hypothetical protein